MVQLGKGKTGEGEIRASKKEETEKAPERGERPNSRIRRKGRYEIDG